MEPTSVDLTSYLNLRGDDDGRDRSETIMRMSRPIRHGVTFVEIEVGSAWYNTELSLLGLGEQFSVLLCSDDGGDEHRVALVANDDMGDNVLHLVPEFFETWEWCETVTFGLLVDMIRGCCTFHLNGQRGPCVKFPGDLWRRHGIQIAIEGFPANVSDTPPCVLTCSSFVPQGAMRDPATPKTVAEHHASGVLEYDYH